MTTSLQIRVGHLVRMLSSDQIGEAGAAAQALHRMVVNAGHDIHWLADVVVAALLPSQEPPAKQDDGDAWIEVDGYSLSYHRKPGSRPCLCISYRCGTATYRDYWMLQHTGMARQIATEKWSDLGGDDPPPRNVGEAIDRIEELSNDVVIAVRFNSESGFWEVVGQRIRQEVSA